MTEKPLLALISLCGVVFLGICFQSLLPTSPILNLFIGSLLTIILAIFLEKNSSKIFNITSNNIKKVKNIKDNSKFSKETKTIYVGNLPYKANESQVRKLFAEYGRVKSVKLMKDRFTGKRRGFGFVEMPAAKADIAITSLNNSLFGDRTLKVTQANKHKETTVKNEVEDKQVTAEL